MTEDRAPHSEIRHRFEAELEDIKRGTVRLGSMVLENAGRLYEALLENRLDLAQQVIDGDEEIDQAYIDLERRVFKVIALQQPVAGDLRFLVSITRVLHEIERSGDLVVNGAKGILRQQGYRLSSQLQGVLARLCRAAIDVFARGVDALADMDPDAAPRLDREDDLVDTLVSGFYTLLTTEADGKPIDTAIELSRVGRYLERFADHGVNVGEHVAFMVTGIFPRHDKVAGRAAGEAGPAEPE